MLAAAASLSVLLALANVLPTVGGERSEITHCVVVVVDQEPDGELVTTQPTCGPSRLEAIEKASSILADATGLSTVDTAGLLSFTLGTHYDGASGTGSSISVVGSSCTGGYWNTPAAWDNRISSSYNGCARLRHWDSPDKVGTFQDTAGVGTTDNLTTLNNQAESVSYHAS